MHNQISCITLQTFRLNYPRRVSPQKLSDFAQIARLFSLLLLSGERRIRKMAFLWEKRCFQEMVIGHNFVRAGEFTESFPEKPPHRNSECFWRVFQKLSGLIWRVECGEALHLRKCMESLKVRIYLALGHIIKMHC